MDAVFMNYNFISLLLRSFRICFQFLILYIYDIKFTKKNLQSPDTLKTYVPGSNQKNK